MNDLLNDPPTVLCEKFGALKSPYDLADLVQVEYKYLVRNFYGREAEHQYTTFRVPKNSQGQFRVISAPKRPQKYIQFKLAQILQAVYKPPDFVHGFVLSRSVVTNADAHLGCRYLLNLDLEDFFPSINFGRVRGLFIHRYGLDQSVSTVLAQICCFDNQLPQGAPTSPVVANMICARMDNQLLHLAERNECIYTRYADDITFSTLEPHFPHRLARPSTIQVKRGNKRPWKIGEDLLDIVESNGFRVQRSKVRIQEAEKGPQIVTGLVVNKKLNVRRKFVRQIRAMLHAWQKFGPEKAEEEYFKKYDKQQRPSFKPRPWFKDIVRGKIAFLGMVRGKNDNVYVRYWNELVHLEPNFGKPKAFAGNKYGQLPQIFTEGKTDLIHLKTALMDLQQRGRYRDLQFDFHEGKTGRGSGYENLFKMCQNYAAVNQPQPRIFLFDRDIRKPIRDQVQGDGGKAYRSWGNNVFSLILPIPSHRSEDDESVCIELFYQDKDLLREDRQNRRLFFNREFHENSGRHFELSFICQDRNKLRNQRVLALVDADVYDFQHNNVALSKSDFATCIEMREQGFEDLDFSEFAKIFDVIKQITDEHRRS
jgi:RNA-directed DNA polymerase